MYSHLRIVLKEKKNCADLYKAGKTSSGIYSIDPDGQGAFDVFCDQTTNGGGWTVFQKRMDGSIDFYRGWNDYKEGFGDLKGEFWLGLDKIHRLTSPTSTRLHIDLADWDDKAVYAEYTGFSVAGEDDKYKMTFSTYARGKNFNSPFKEHRGHKN